MKKKWMLPFMGIFMALSIVGCGKENTAETPETKPAVEETQEVEETISENEIAVTEEVVEEPEVAVASEPVVEEVAPVVDANVYGVTAVAPVVKYANKSLNVRAIPSTDGELVGTAVTNTEITVVGTTSALGYEGWSQVEYNGVVAFIKSTLLSDSKVKISAPAKNTNTSSSSGASSGGSSSASSGGGAPNGGLDMSGLGDGEYRSGSGGSNNGAVPDSLIGVGVQ